MRRINLPGLAFILALLVLWQLAAMADHSPNLPGFIQVIGALISDHTVIIGELGHTLVRAGTGFALALVTMVPLGIILGRVRPLGEFTIPMIELIRPLPPIAIVPVMMIFFGVGDVAKILVVTYGASFPILINTIDAVRAVDPMLSTVSRSLRLTQGERMRLVDLPSALPRILAGVRISIAVSLLIAVVAEMLLSTNGLGAFLTQAQESFQIANELAGLVVIALVAISVNAAARAVERHLLGWHYARNIDNPASRNG